jgi:Cdc6-like AAA superfamily ATPase
MTNFAITGVRRMGKTSLLREIRRTIIERGEERGRFVWLDCSTLSGPSQFIEEVVRQLNIRELPRLKKIQDSLFSFEDFLKRMPKMHGGPITFFLDEADQFLVWARDVSSPVLRASVNSGDCRYIIAGFQNLLKEQSDRKSPFYLSFESIDLLPFKAEETAEVVRQPMRSLRVQIENEGQLVSQIHADTRGHPQLVQYYCVELVKLLDRQNSRRLSPAALSNIYASEGFKNLILNAFRDNVGMQDKVLVYALLNTFPETKETFTHPEMHGALQRHRCKLVPDEIDRTCARLVMAGVFVREGQKYEFAIPVFPRVLRANYDMNYLLSVAKKEIAL